MARETVFPSHPSSEPDRAVPTVVWERDKFVDIATRLSSAEHDEGARWAPLDRAQINALISVLRRARDAAYGADA